ncbi:MAG: glycogen synthase GlgA [Halothiobacillus sp.]|nr:glycogen synthase GlgA [Halothiobacillus sp.]
MNVLFATSEMFPLIKTGGLADVSGALPLALSQVGVDVRVVLPRYANIKADLIESETQIGQRAILGQPVKINLATLSTGHRVYLVDHPVFSARQGNPYIGPDGNNWHDNPDRFSLFCRAVVALSAGLFGEEWKPDIIHSNDWQTGLIPALLSESNSPKNIFTIHNLAYQGVFDRPTFERLGLPWSLWRPDALEYWGNMSFMKAGIVFADFVTTVSQTYAQEIQSPEFGYGLDGLLHHKRDRLKGILNGIGEDWNPQTDQLLENPFSTEDMTGKAIIKENIQREFGLTIDGNIPLITHVGRLVEQKGIDLLIQAIETLGGTQVQFAILGAGEHRFEHALRSLAAKNPDRIAVVIGYDEKLAHRLEAAGDAFIMPSRFEPCGLNQMYSLRYGALPIVHRVGGLADTVTHITPESIKDGSASGIVIDHLDVSAIHWAIGYFMEIYRDQDLYKKIQRQGMQKDFGWITSATEYKKIYSTALKEQGHDESSKHEH